MGLMQKLALRLSTACVLAFILCACGAGDTAAVDAVDHPSFPCYTWWTASSRVAGLAGVVPWMDGAVISHEELFDLAEQWVPASSDAAAYLRELRAQAPEESATSDEKDMFAIQTILAVYQWAMFNLDLAYDAVDSSTEVQESDREPLLSYILALEGSVEDQYALAAPMFDLNPYIDVVTLGKLTETSESQLLYQAWRDVTEDSPFDTEAGIRDASMNVCGEKVLEIGQ